jgi:hypothetical protein
LGFNEDQVQALRELGVSGALRHALTAMLPACGLALTPPAPFADVRNELDRLMQELRVLENHLTRLDQAGGGPSAISDARARIQAASYERAFAQRRGPALELETALPRVQALRAIAQEARATVPAGPRRFRSASPIPVRMIHQALLSAWADEHLSSLPKSGLTPPFPFRPSSGPKSAFRAIVGICYAAVLGTTEHEAERAIRAFVRQEREAARGRAKDRQGPDWGT